MVEKSLILKYEVKLYTFLFFFFTIHFKFQNMLLMSFFFQNIISFGHPNYRCPKSIYRPPNQSLIWDMLNLLKALAKSEDPLNRQTSSDLS